MVQLTYLPLSNKSVLTFYIKTLFKLQSSSKFEGPFIIDFFKKSAIFERREVEK